MNKTIFAILIVAAVSLSGANAQVSNLMIPIAVSVTITTSTPDPKLLVQLTNRSAAPLTVYKSALPWGNRYSMIIVGVKLTGLNEILSSSPIIDDPGPERVVIRPGETISGEVSLVHRFANLRDVAEKTDILLLWSYQLQTTDKQKSERLGGWVQIQRK